MPFSKTGGLADVVEALPKALVAAGHEVAVVLPRYRGTKATAVVMPSLTIPMANHLRFPAVMDGTQISGVRYFFVDDPAYFDRDGIYGSSDGDFPDNAERYSEFCRAAIEIVKHVWPADVIHCHDWQTALVPVLLRTSYGDDPLVKDIPVVFTIHNMGYHGLFKTDVLERAGIPLPVYNPAGMEFYGNVNFLKGGLVYSDYLTTVSKRYAQEIQTPEFGWGLDGVVRSRCGADGWHFERSRLLRVESGKRQTDSHEIFREGYERKAGVQAGLAGIVRNCAGALSAPSDWNCVALRRSERIRFDRGESL